MFIASLYGLAKKLWTAMAVHDVILVSIVEKLYSPVLNGVNPVVQHLGKQPVIY